MDYSGAGGKLIHEKNQKQKILWHCPFKQNPQKLGINRCGWICLSYITICLRVVKNLLYQNAQREKSL